VVRRVAADRAGITSTARPFSVWGTFGNDTPAHPNQGALTPLPALAAFAFPRIDNCGNPPTRAGPQEAEGIDPATIEFAVDQEFIFSPHLGDASVNQYVRRTGETFKVRALGGGNAASHVFDGADAWRRFVTNVIYASVGQHRRPNYFRVTCCNRIEDSRRGGDRILFVSGLSERWD